MTDGKSDLSSFVGNEAIGGKASARLDEIGKIVGGFGADQSSALKGISDQLTAGGSGLPKSFVNEHFGSKASLDASKALSAIADQLTGATGGVAIKLRDQLADYNGATKHLRDAMEHINGTSAQREKLLGEKRDFIRDILAKPDYPTARFPPFPKMPPNPIFKTNELLTELKAEVAELHEVTEVTAEVQARQSEIVGTILNTFVEGAAASEKSGNQNLLIAKLGLMIAIIAIILNLIQLFKS